MNSQVFVKWYENQHKLKNFPKPTKNSNNAPNEHLENHFEIINKQQHTHSIKPLSNHKTIQDNYSKNEIFAQSYSNSATMANESRIKKNLESIISVLITLLTVFICLFSVILIICFLLHLFSKQNLANKLDNTTVIISTTTKLIIDTVAIAQNPIEIMLKPIDSTTTTTNSMILKDTTNSIIPTITNTTKNAYTIATTSSTSVTSMSSLSNYSLN